MSGISDTLLKQRLRNRIIEALASFADEGAVGSEGTNEIIETWYDFVGGDRMAFYDSPVFSSEEINAITRFHSLLERSYREIPATWKPEELADCKEWSVLTKSALSEHAIFMKRGLFDEEREII